MMLSEQRKSQNNRLWSDFAINPRGELWKKDEQNFGCKLMKQMGWTKGSGLGKHENGITAPIRTVQTHDNEGLGYSKRTSDYSWNWLSHQDDYTTLLNQLQKQHWITAETNSCGVQNNPNNSHQQSKVDKEMKTSKKRERYQRNIEGKRMTNRSEAEWQCILGKKRSESTQEVLEECSATENTHNSQELLISSTLSSHAYFMQKKLKLSTVTQQNGDSKGPDASEEVVGTEVDTTVSRNSDASHSNVNKTKKKKKRKPKGREKRKKLARLQMEVPSECGSVLYSPSSPVTNKEDSKGGKDLSSTSSSSQSCSTGSGTEPPIKNDCGNLEELEPRLLNTKSVGNKIAYKYRCFLECISNDPIFQTCNLLSIKGYGNR